jgi:hypothetical protein
MQKENQEELEIKAKKLAYLLYHSTLPEDVRHAWFSLIPQMTMEQVDRLLNILEAKYLDEATIDIDEELKDKLKKLLEK